MQALANARESMRRIGGSSPEVVVAVVVGTARSWHPVRGSALRSCGDASTSIVMFRSTSSSAPAGLERRMNGSRRRWPRMPAPADQVATLTPATQAAGITAHRCCWHAVRDRAICALAAAGLPAHRIASLVVPDLLELKLPGYAWRAIALALGHKHRPNCLLVAPATSGRVLLPNHVSRAIRRHATRVGALTGVHGLREADRMAKHPRIGVGCAPLTHRATIMREIVAVAHRHRIRPDAVAATRPSTRP